MTCQLGELSGPQRPQSYHRANLTPSQPWSKDFLASLSIPFVYTLLRRPARSGHTVGALLSLCSSEKNTWLSFMPGNTKTPTHIRTEWFRRCVCSGSPRPGFEAWLSRRPTVYHCATNLASLSLPFLVCKMELKDLSLRVTRRSRWPQEYVARTCPGRRR